MKARFTPCLRHSLLISLVLLPSVHAQSVWTGSSDSVLSNGTNYDPTIANTAASGLNIQFNGTDETTTDLTLATAMGGSAGTGGSALSVLAEQVNPLTITGSDTAAIRLNSAGFTVEEGTLENPVGAVNFAGTGTIILGGLSTATSHTISNASSNLLSFGDWGIVRGGGVTRNLDIGGSGDIESNGVWNNTINLDKTGAGTLTLGGSNTHTGTTTVSGGTLKLTNALALQTSALDTSGAGTVTLDGPTTLTLGGLAGSTNLTSVITTGYGVITELTLNPGSGTQTYAGTIANGAADMNLVKSGAGTQVLSGANSFTGTTSVNGGKLTLGNADALGNGSVKTSMVTVTGTSGSIAASIGSLDLAGFSPAAIPLELNSGANNNDVGAFYNSTGTATTWAGSVTLLRATIVGAGNIELTGGFDGGGFSLTKNGLSNFTITNGGTTTLNQLNANRGTIVVNSGTILNVATIDVGTGNSVGAGLTLNGGSVTASGQARFGQGSGTASGTLTLNAGTLTVPALTKGTLTFNANFNGGTLKASADTVSFFDTATSAKVQANGAVIDDGDFTITIAQPLIHDPALLTADGGLTKQGAGTLTLSGSNTYNGNTTISAGNFELAATGSLTFVPTTPGTTNKVTGSGSASFKGSFAIDLTNAEVADDNSWILADVPGQTFDETSFSVGGFTESPEGTWTLEDEANTWTFTQSDATLRLDVAASGYASWLTLHPGITDPAAGADPENDGIENVLEYVLNGNPMTSDPSILPDLDASGANFVFTFTRREESAADTTQVFEYGTDLNGWTPLSITAPTATEVSLGTPAGGLQTVTVTISKALAGPGGKLFGRLMVTEP